MAIQKKSLISTLKTAKKANLAAENKGEKQVSAYKFGNLKTVAGGNVVSAKDLKSMARLSAKDLKSFKRTFLKAAQ
jgi:hypothetical protein